MTTSRITSELWEKISRSWQEDSELSKIIEQVQQDPNSKPHYTWVHDQLKRKGRIVVGQNEVVKQLLLNEFHGSFADGRIGVEVTRRRQ